MLSEQIVHPYLLQIDVGSLHHLTPEEVLRRFGYSGDFSIANVRHFYVNICADMYRHSAPNRELLQPLLYQAVSSFEAGESPAQIESFRPISNSTSYEVSNKQETPSPIANQKLTRRSIDFDQILLEKALSLLQLGNFHSHRLLLATISKKRRQTLRSKRLYQIFCKLYLASEIHSDRPRPAFSTTNHSLHEMNPIFFE